MKKAQAAMEFLMTYGWAILVVIIMIGALAYFGVLSPINFSFRICSCGETEYPYQLYMTVHNNTEFFDCFQADYYLDYEAKKIRFNSTNQLFFCDENRDMVAVS